MIFSRSRSSPQRKTVLSKAAFSSPQRKTEAKILSFSSLQRKAVGTTFLLLPVNMEGRNKAISLRLSQL